MEPRKRNRLLIGAIMIATIGIGCVLFFSGDSEPAYDGRPLSEWVVMIGVKKNPSLYTESEKEAATEAIQAIGTNALPHLIQWLAYEPTGLRRFVFENFQKVPNRFLRNPSVLLVTFKPLIRALGAEESFSILGPSAASAIPALTQILHSTNYSIGPRYNAVSALARIGPSAMTAMTNILATAPHDEQRWVLNFFARMGTNAAPAVPALIHQVHHGDMRTAELSAETLGTLRLVPDEAVPALIDGLADPNSRMRAAAAKALGSLGSLAIIALPALNQLETDPDQGVSRAARAAITAITGVAPAGPDPLPIGSR